MLSHRWLLFLPQLPSSPSSLRVLVWRRVRTQGAASLQNGAWILPHTPEHERTLRELLAEIEEHGGTGTLFTATPLEPAVEESIIEKFRADRDQEYTEFRGRCGDFMAEIDKETACGNFTFAELEENEHDLHRLELWLAKIQGRDAFGAHQAQDAIADLTRCRQALQLFTQAIYAREGLGLPEGGSLAEAANGNS